MKTKEVQWTREELCNLPVGTKFIGPISKSIYTVTAANRYERDNGYFRTGNLTHLRDDLVYDLILNEPKEIEWV